MRTDSFFLELVNRVIEANYSNEDFGVVELSRQVGISRSGLYRKLKAIIRKSGSQYLREFRLQKALMLLKEGKCTTAEAAYESGFSSATYFHRCFHNFFGLAPGSYRKTMEPGSKFP